MIKTPLLEDITQTYKEHSERLERLKTKYNSKADEYLSIMTADGTDILYQQNELISQNPRERKIREEVSVNKGGVETLESHVFALLNDKKFSLLLDNEGIIHRVEYRQKPFSVEGMIEKVLNEYASWAKTAENFARVISRHIEDIRPDGFDYLIFLKDMFLVYLGDRNLLDNISIHADEDVLVEAIKEAFEDNCIPLKPAVVKDMYQALEKLPEKGRFAILTCEKYAKEFLRMLDKGEDYVTESSMTLGERELMLVNPIVEMVFAGNLDEQPQRYTDWNSRVFEIYTRLRKELEGIDYSMLLQISEARKTKPANDKNNKYHRRGTGSRINNFGSREMLDTINFRADPIQDEFKRFYDAYSDQMQAYLFRGPMMRYILDRILPEKGRVVAVDTCEERVVELVEFCVMKENSGKKYDPYTLIYNDVELVLVNDEARNAVDNLRNMKK